MNPITTADLITAHEALARAERAAAQAWTELDILAHLVYPPLAEGWNALDPIERLHERSWVLGQWVDAQSGHERGLMVEGMERRAREAQLESQRRRDDWHSLACRAVNGEDPEGPYGTPSLESALAAINAGSA